MIQNYARFLIANWVLISFLVSALSALAVTGFVYLMYHVGPFENYRNISTTKKLSAFHERMGDRLMASSEWDAAEQAYRNALQISPNNTAATFGITKAQVFQPPPGKDYYCPEVVDAKLDYLNSCFPGDYQIYFLRAIRCHDRGEDDLAKEWSCKCIEKNSAFIGSYLLLGTIDFIQSEIGKAADNFSKVVKLDPNCATAMNDLAACHMLLMDFAAATRQFEDSYRISPTAVTAFALGEACWFSGQFERALEVHQWALDYMNGTHDAQDRIIGGQWTSGFLPLHPGDVETFKQNPVSINTLEQKKALLHFALCMDRALMGNLEGATLEFAAALKLEQSVRYKRLFQNRMLSVENLVKIPDNVKTWLVENRKTLD
jgi:tetratricopeptide (TPR) repeat protein